ncbi:MAG: universal stress protein [Thermodesulfobacteriota bacterium]
MFDKALYPTDFSEVSQKAVDYLKTMKKAGLKQAVIVHVINDKRIDCISKGFAMAGKETSRFLKEVYDQLLEEASAIADNRSWS